MKKLEKYKKERLSKPKKVLLAFLLILLTIGVGYSALVTNLSITGNILVKKHEEPIAPSTFPTQIQSMIDNNESCLVKYEGNVTDEVNNTVAATKVYFDRCTDKRNVKFSGSCWQVIRTTETGGIKLLYNGEIVDGKCESTRSDHKGIVGTDGDTTALTAEYLYGTSFTYNTTTDEFTLVDTTSATWSASTYQNLLGKFTCKNTSGTCTTLYNINGYDNATTAFTSSYTISNTNYAQIGESPFNANTYSLAMVGYKFNNVYLYESEAPGTNTYKYGSTFTYDTGTNTYTLSGTTQDISDWSTGYNTINNTHYTCWNASGSCTTISYIYFTDSNEAEYIDISGGKNISDAINEMLYNNDVNTYDSSIKGITDSWYAQNMNSKTSMIEDAIYCNARNTTSLGGWTPDGGDTVSNFSIDFIDNVSDMTCTNETDQFAVSNNKAKLTYPVGLLQINERKNVSTSSLMAIGAPWWSISPIDYGDARVRYMNNSGIASPSYTITSYGVRPVISLKSGTVISEGDGSTTSPWVIQE